MSVADLSPHTIVRAGMFAGSVAPRTVVHLQARMLARLHVHAQRGVRIHKARQLLAQERPGVSGATYQSRFVLNLVGARIVSPVMFAGRRCAPAPVVRRATTPASVRRAAMVGEGIT